MSARIKGFMVALSEDMHHEDAEGIAQAISMIKGVAQVKASETNSEDWMNRSQIRHKIAARLWKVLEDKE